MRKLIVMGIVAVFAGGLALSTGCGKKKGGGGAFNCDTVAAKTKKCADAIADAFVKDMGKKMKGKIPAAALEKMKGKIKESFASKDFAAKCKKDWDSKKDKDVKMKAMMKKCFAKSSCSDYAACFMAAIKEAK